MSVAVSKSHFKSHALELLRQVEVTGEPLLITDRGRPTIEIRRYRFDLRPPVERLRGSVVDFQDPFAPVGHWKER